MATYQRQAGQNDVYDTSGAQPRYISFDEAQKNNIWSQIQEVPARTLDNRSPSAGAETSLNFDRGNQGQSSISLFNSAIMEMLKSAQKGLGTKQSQTAAIDLSNQQVQRGQAQATPGMNPSLQSSIRNADMNAINPSIQGANDQTQTMQERLSGFSSLLDQARTFGESIQKMEQQKKSEAIGLVDKILKEGTSSDMEALLRSNPELLKMAGYKSDLFSSLIDSRKKSETAMQQQEQTKAQQDQQLYDLNVAQKKKDLGKPYYAPSSGGGSAGGSGSMTTDVSKMSQEAQAVLNGTIRLEDLTPTLKGKIAGELNAAGFKSTPKLSSTQQDEIATMETVKDLMNKVVAYNADGKLEGIGGFYGGTLGGLATQYFGTGSEEAKNVRALISNIKGTIAKLRGGTSFTPNEQKMLENYTPTIDESAASALAKIEMLVYAIDKKKTELLNVAQDRKLPNQTSPVLDNLRTKYNY